MREDWLTGLVGLASAAVLGGGLLAATAMSASAAAVAAEAPGAQGAPTAPAPPTTCDDTAAAVLTLVGQRDHEAFRLTGRLTRGGCPLVGRVLDLMVDGGGPVATVLTGEDGSYRVRYEPAPGGTATYVFTTRAGAALSPAVTLR